MVEIIVHFIASPLFPAAEYIHIIPCLRAGSNNAHQSSLIRPALRLTESYLTIGDGSKSFTRFRRSRKTGKQIERMITFHHRITGNAIYTNRIMAGELRVIFRIVQTAIQKKSDTRIRSQHISFSVKLHRNAIRVHMIAFTCVERNHQTVARMHPVALYQPRYVGGIEQRRYIILDFPRLHLRVQHQRLVLKERIDRSPYILLATFFAAFLRIQTFQQSGEVTFLLFLSVCLRILYHPDKEVRT